MINYFDAGTLFGVSLFGFALFAAIGAIALIEQRRFKRYLRDSKQLDAYEQWRNDYNKRRAEEGRW